MISDARDYFKARIAELPGRKFREHKDAFNRDNIPKSTFDRSYHITLQNSANINTEGCLVDDTVVAQVEFFFKGFRTPQDAYDAGIDIGHELKLRSVNPAKWSGSIKRVVGDSVVVEPVLTNDNEIIVQCTFTLRMMFSALS